MGASGSPPATMSVSKFCGARVYAEALCAEGAGITCCPPIAMDASSTNLHFQFLPDLPMTGPTRDPKQATDRVADLEFLFTHLERQLAELNRVVLDQQRRIE